MLKNIQYIYTYLFIYPQVLFIYIEKETLNYVDHTLYISLSFP